MTTIKITGAKELEAALADMSQEVQNAVEGVVDATGLELRGDIVKRYNRGPASGRTYQKYSPRRTHTASAPGQAPQTDTGRLAGSVTYVKNSPLTVTVQSALPYAAWLEFGTTEMSPRPAWTPAAEEAQPKFQKRMENAVGSAIK